MWNPRSVCCNAEIYIEDQKLFCRQCKKECTVNGQEKCPEEYVNGGKASFGNCSIEQ